MKFERRIDRVFKELKKKILRRILIIGSFNYLRTSKYYLICQLLISQNEIEYVSLYEK